MKDQLIFKGGTSLSKGYGVTERFSEDIDLSVHASVFGVEIESNFSELSKSQVTIASNQLYRAARLFIEGTLIAELAQQLAASLGDLKWSLKLKEEERFPYTTVPIPEGHRRWGTAALCSALYSN